MQDALSKITGVRTVPQVFVGGEFIGGCDGVYWSPCWKTEENT